ncbi:MAG: beta-lactamase family protein [Candidatus Dormibacteraeota bacterium]|nr:beta-lactamase family protein [Candidatus Dormibacteraeota bacterium]
MALPGSMAAQSVSPSPLDSINAIYAKWSKPDGPGCAMGVYQNGAISIEKGYGLANLEYAAPSTPQTPFIVGSVSKQFTAAAIALLATRGQLSLDDDIRKYVPEIPDYGKTITVGGLVHHTSGLRDFWTLVGAAGMRYDDTYNGQDILRLAARQHHLSFDPGSQYAYSNTGYVVLGFIVQRVSGKSLREFAQENIFGPLGMTHTHYQDDHTLPVHGRASAYEPASNGGWKIDVWNNEVVGQGGVMTTIEDLQKWDENFYTGKVGGPKFLAQQLERGKLNDGTTLNYAFGLEILTYRGLPMVEHTGSTGGYRAAITRFPTLHTTVVSLCNATTADAAGMNHRVADVVLGSKFPQPVAAAPARGGGAGRGARQAGAPIAMTSDMMANVTGRYYSDELDATYEVVNQNGTLVVQRPRGVVDTLQAVDAHTFRARGTTFSFLGTPAVSFTIDVDRARGIEFKRQ